MFFQLREILYKNPFDMQELMGVTQQLEENVTSTSATEEENINISNENFIEYDKCVQKITDEQEEVISLQDDIVSTGGYLAGLLSLSERNSIKTEVGKAKKLFNRPSEGFLPPYCRGCKNIGVSARPLMAPIVFLLSERKLPF